MKSKFKTESLGRRSTFDIRQLVLFLPVVIATGLTWSFINNGEWWSAGGSALATILALLLFRLFVKGWVSWILWTIIVVSGFLALQHTLAAGVMVIALVVWIVLNPHYAHGGEHMSTILPFDETEAHQAAAERDQAALRRAIQPAQVHHRRSHSRLHRRQP